MNTLERLKEILEKLLEGTSLSLDNLNDDTHISDLYLDSITLLVVGIAIEEEFKVRLTTEDMSHLKTVGDLIAKIERN